MGHAHRAPHHRAHLLAAAALPALPLCLLFFFFCPPLAAALGEPGNHRSEQHPRSLSSSAARPLLFLPAELAPGGQRLRCVHEVAVPVYGKLGFGCWDTTKGLMGKREREREIAAGLLGVCVRESTCGNGSGLRVSYFSKLDRRVFATQAAGFQFSRALRYGSLMRGRRGGGFSGGRNY